MRSFAILILLIAGPAVSHADESVADLENSRQNSGPQSPQLDEAVTSIRDQVDWFGERPISYSREFLTAVATMNYVQSRVSPLNYSLLVKAKKPLPITAEEYLAAQAGICGGQVMTFLQILNRLGIRNRPVEFYIRGQTRAENHSHIGAEVFYADKWHFFDITWGTYYRRGGQASTRVDDVLSISEILATEKTRQLAVTNLSDLWFQQWTTNGLDPFEYLTANQMDLIVGRGGVVTLRPANDAKSPYIYIPTHQPNYIGRNNRSPDFGSLSFRLTDVKRTPTICNISVSGVAGSGKLVIRGTSGEVTRSLSVLKPGDHRIDLSNLEVHGELHLTVDTGDNREVGYFVFKQISLDFQ
jgi:hypothetical protein